MSRRMHGIKKTEMFNMIRVITVWCRVMIVVTLTFWPPGNILGQTDDYRDVMSITQREAENSDEALEHEKKVDLRVFTSEDSGKEYNLSVGEEFQVRLWDNPTTGYVWTILKSSSPNIELERKEFLPPKEPNVVGASGVRVLVLKATKPGEAILHLGLKRPWETEDKCDRTYSLKLVVE